MRTLRPSALSRTLALASPAVSLVIQRAEAQFNAFIKFDDIQGESTDKAHPSWCTAANFKWGLAKPYTPGAPTSPTSASSLIIDKLIDRASPVLFLRCAQGTHLPTVTLELSRSTAAGTVPVFYKIVLTDVVITNITTKGDPASTTANAPTESIELSYSTLSITYSTIDSKGGTVTQPTVTYDFNPKEP